MPNVLIRDLPPKAHRRLTKRASDAGQSLQQYLVSELVRLAERPTMGEVLGKLDKHRGSVGFDQAVDDLGTARAER